MIEGTLTNTATWCSIVPEARGQQMQSDTCPTHCKDEGRRFILLKLFALA